MDSDLKDAYLALRKHFTVEQIAQIAALIDRLQERARDRKCQQSLTIILNESGIPRWLKGSDDVEFAKP